MNSRSEPRWKAHAAHFWQGLARDGSRSVNVAVFTPSAATTARRTPYPSVRRASARSSPRAGATDRLPHCDKYTAFNIGEDDEI